MIELQNIQKIYQSGRKKECRALDGVSFSLPDRGMVFVLGKSGSGKSTLLNILGGLDNATEGELWINGNRFSAFTPAEQDHYRNLYVGFIFQDFCLIDGLTVTDNVRLSLDLLGEENEERVERLIDEVGLTAEKHRSPRELSGGQCQRVAIARALAKDPRVLLADEPTGNLDSRTAKQILSLLKELSADRLVVVVSHNVSDAETYADRIIELGDGQIVRDVARTEDDRIPLIEEDRITLPRGRALSEEELVAINRRITEGGATVTQARDPFEPTPPIEKGEHRPIGSPKKMKRAAYVRLTKMISRRGYVGTALTAFILAVLTLLLCFAQSFALFDSAPLMRDAAKHTDEHSFALHKGYYDTVNSALNTDKTVPVTEEDIASFYEAGYEGKHYLLYDSRLSFVGQWDKTPISLGDMEETVLNFDTPYARHGNGVLVTEESFLIKLYGKDGAIQLLAGEISEKANQGGVLISDYAADCIAFYNRGVGFRNEQPYRTIVEGGALTGTNISGVFATGYKERYAELFDRYNAIKAMTDEEARQEAIREMSDSDLFHDFANEVDKYLSIGYFLGENYQETVTKVNSGMNVGTCFHNTSVYSEGRLLQDELDWMYKHNALVAPGTVLLGMGMFNKLFGTEYTQENASSFTPVEITIRGSVNGQGEPLYEHTVTIVGFDRRDDAGFSFSTEDYLMHRSYDHYPYAVYFDNADSAAALYEVAEKHGFYANNFYFQSVNTVREIVEIFRELFIYVVLGVSAVALLLIMSFSLRSLRRRMREIGILRALGANTGQIAACFIAQTVFLWGFVVLLAFAVYPFLVSEANLMLVEGMAKFLENPAIANLTVLSSTLLSLLAVLAIFLPVLLLSLCVPLLFIRKLKPMKIIRTAE